MENYASRQVPQWVKAFGVHLAIIMFPEYKTELIGQATQGHKFLKSRTSFPFVDAPVVFFDVFNGFGGGFGAGSEW